MYTAYAFGYRRTSPLFSIHSYRHITRPVEINPWLEGIGRGTFLNVLNKIKKAIAFALAPSDFDPGGGKRSSEQAISAGCQSVSNAPTKIFNENLFAAVKNASATSLRDIPDGQVDLVLTDPPYFDNLSYSELSDFYLAWHQVLGVAEGPYRNPQRHAPLQKSLVVRANEKATIELYRRELSGVFAECKRVLTPKGLCVFTYHHRSAEAWLSLGYALAASGLTCTAVLPMRGEGQGGLHSFEGTLKWDAVFVCRNSNKCSSTTSGSLVVAESAALKAKESAAAFYARLSANKRIGFKVIDRLNLFRALTVASSKLGAPQRGYVLVSEVITEQGV
jgi:adenine-specific DNA methylase